MLENGRFCEAFEDHYDFYVVKRNRLSLQVSTRYYWQGWLITMVGGYLSW